MPAPAATRAMASAPYLGIVQSVTSEMQTLLDDKNSAALNLLVARGVEAPAVLAQAKTWGIHLLGFA